MVRPFARHQGCYSSSCFLAVVPTAADIRRVQSLCPGWSQNTLGDLTVPGTVSLALSDRLSAADSPPVLPRPAVKRESAHALKELGHCRAHPSAAARQAQRLGHSRPDIPG